MSTPNMGLTLPVDHASSDIWATILSTVFDAIDSHDHSTGKGVKVPTAGLNINADLSFSPSGTPRAITDLKAIDFAAVASSSVTGLAGAFFVSDGTGGLTANELYYRTVLGSNVQVTLGAALNVAAFAGGIGGDYIASLALLSYDAASLSYWLQQPGSPRPWARLRSGDVDIYETAASIVNRVRLKSPAALAASYDVTWPASAPGSTSLVQMSSAGVLTASNTVANAVTLSSAATLSSSLSVGTTMVVTGIPTFNSIIQANSGIDVGTNQSVTVHGTGAFKHGTRTKSISCFGFVMINGVGDYTSNRLTGSGTALFRAAIQLHTGDRIQAIRVYITDSSTGPTTMQATFMSATAGSAGSGVASSSTSAGSGSLQTLTIGSLTTTLVTGSHYWIQVNTISGAANQLIWMAEVDYDRP